MNSLNDQLALAPLGAGDLIDRAVRMYRHHVDTTIRIARGLCRGEFNGPHILPLAVLGVDETTLRTAEMTLPLGNCHLRMN